LEDIRTREMSTGLRAEEHVNHGHRILLTNMCITLTACILTEVSPQLGTNAAILLLIILKESGALQRMPN